MEPTGDDWRWTAARAAAAPNEAGRASALLFRHGSMSLRWYVPPDPDPQGPHDQDELYVVAAGRARFAVADAVHPAEPGDVLFVPAGVAHRFLEPSPDFAVWVVFYGPAGGEAAV